MPKHWIRSGKKYKRRFYVDDTKELPLNVVEAEKAFSALFDELKRRRVVVTVLKGETRIQLDNVSCHYDFEDVSDDNPS